MHKVYLGIGSNLGDRRNNLVRALDALTRCGVVAGARSPLYETEPWGVEDQPRFLNGAVCISTALAPHGLLDLLKLVEWAMGRRVGVRYGPRIIDLDILFYDDLCVHTPRLQIPHPGVTGRASVLVPLADIAADLSHPLTGFSISEHLAALGAIEGVALYPPGL